MNNIFNEKLARIEARRYVFENIAKGTDAEWILEAKRNGSNFVIRKLKYLDPLTRRFTPFYLMIS